MIRACTSAWDWRQRRTSRFDGRPDKLRKSAAWRRINWCIFAKARELSAARSLQELRYEAVSARIGGRTGTRPAELANRASLEIGEQWSTGAGSDLAA